MDDIQNKSSACVEVLRSLTHDVATYFNVTDFHRSHQEVSIEGDLEALLIDLNEQSIHSYRANRRVPPPHMKKRKGTQNARKQKRTTGVRDVLTEGLQALTRTKLFEKWRNRTMEDGDGTGDDTADGLDDTMDTGYGFDEPEGAMDVDVNEDEEFHEATAQGEEAESDE